MEYVSKSQTSFQFGDRTFYESFPMVSLLESEPDAARPGLYQADATVMLDLCMNMQDPRLRKDSIYYKSLNAICIAYVCTSLFSNG